MTRTFTALITATLLGLSLAPVASAIENGKADRWHRNVGALGFRTFITGNTLVHGRCSGFVISDRAFVTAAHCFDDVEAIATSWEVTLKPGKPGNPVIAPGLLAADLSNALEFPILVETVAAIGYQRHPNPAIDIAVLEFPAGTFKQHPVRLARTGFLDRLARSGALFHVPVGLSGYGADSFDPASNTFTIPGYRKRGFTGVSAVTDTHVTLAANEVFNSTAMPADSGGPNFIAGRVVSLVGLSFDSPRLDTQEVRNFLAPYLD